MKFFLTYYFFSKEDELFPDPISGSPEGVIGLLLSILGEFSPILYTFNIVNFMQFLNSVRSYKLTFLVGKL